MPLTYGDGLSIWLSNQKPCEVAEENPPPAAYNASMRIIFTLIALLATSALGQESQLGRSGQSIISYSLNGAEKPYMRGGVQINAGYRPATTSYWNWSAPAKYHAAAVAVKCGPYGGTGTLVAASWNTGIVLTAYHVVEGKRDILVTWKNGHRSTGKYLDGYYAVGYDIAIIQVVPPTNAVVIPVATTAPRVGTPIEILGYGGAAASPSTGLRHFTGHVTESRGTTLYADTRVISGDSGSGVIADGKLVGVVSGYSYAVGSIIEGGQRWPVGTPTRATSAPIIQRLLSRWQCGPNGCSPVSPTLPPVQSPVASPTLPPRPVQVDIDYAKLIDMMAKDGRFIGPAGANGTDGKPGSMGPIGPAGKAATVEDVIAAIPPRVVEIVDAEGNIIDSDVYQITEPIQFMLLPRGAN